MRLLAASLALAVVFSPGPVAEDVTGKWSGSFVTMDSTGEGYTDTIVLTLKQRGRALTGTVLTGSAGPKPFPFSKGEVAGTKVAFDVVTGPMTTRFALTLAEGHLRGQATADFQGQKLVANVDVQGTR